MVKQHDLRIRVRYNETDSMGLVHHANYLTYFELGRTELFRAQGGDYRALEDQGLYLVIIKAICNYLLPARYDDLLTLRTKFAAASAAKLEHDYALFRDRQLLATGHTVLACVNHEGKVQRMHDVLGEFL